MLQPIIVNNFSTHSYIADILKNVICFLYNALETPISWPPGVSALGALNDSRWQRHLAKKILVVLSALHTKQI